MVHKKECLRLVKERKKNGHNMKEDGVKDRKKRKSKSIQEEEDKEDCPICADALPKSGSQFMRCLNGAHVRNDLAPLLNMNDDQFKDLYNDFQTTLCGIAKIEATSTLGLHACWTMKNYNFPFACKISLEN